MQRRADGAAAAHERAGHGGMRRGHRKIGTLLKREGFRHDVEMLYRVYREKGLSLRYRSGRRSESQAARRLP
ncbi:MAG TPA: hypothetical protein VF780_00325 [Nitrosospira sp.]